MRDNTMGYTCDGRAQYITDGDVCVQAFLVCCTEMASKKIESKQDALLLSLSEEDDDAYMQSEDIVSRRQIPESWMWGDTNLPECPAQDKHCESTSVIRNIILKDSITSWQITAISLSKTHGICVADPFEMIVLKEFFIDLKLPYTAVRNEQLEVKAILHNYSEDPIIVCVELMENDEVCSSASKKGKYSQEVNMDAMSTRVVSYVIIPMKQGMYSIEVKASVKNSDSNDEYALPEEKDSDCESFDLSVTLTKMDKTSHEDAKESFMLTIEVLYRNSERDATMSILDIGLLTGFIVDTDDLKRLSTGRERYIEKFEMDKVLSERGSLILYLNKVSHKLEERISFKIHRVQEVGVLQPAAVSVYEYYNQKHCEKFYHPQREGGTLSRLSLGDVCTCAEESCSMQKKDEPDVNRNTTVVS
ncbi:complement C3-like [Salvelinus sp. IW2-2015]|uniref:complement C3-like n=1 Tax=Salvelinus sp. IW2-2015 TaxID=2691554 RepID=UPI0038D36E62